MAFENLFIRRRKKIGSIELDAVISENTDEKVTVTRNPVEFKANITDHAIIEPVVINLVATVSNSPLGTASLGVIQDNVTGLFGTSTETNLTRSQQAYRDMVKLMKLREPVELQTNLDLYENMLITRVNVTQDVHTSRIVDMNIQLEEILIVETQFTQLSDEQLQAGSPKQQGTPNVDRGRQETVVPDDQTQGTYLKQLKENLKPILSDLLGG